MEKLIELLNEYVEETDFWDNLNEYNEADIIDGETLEVNWNYHDIEYLYTKQFWFIKWLVENDKIDIVKVYENLTDYEIEIRIRAVKELLENNEEDTISYLKLLMLLSIQDEPIRFLCEILK
jgi:hypothetical protein